MGTLKTLVLGISSMHLLQVCLPLLLLLLGVPHSAPHRYVSLAGMAGSVQQAGQTLAAGLAANTQWFQPVGAGVAACNTEATSATLLAGWPGYQGNTVTQQQVGSRVSICIRRKRIFRGGRFGPWRFVTGTVRQGFRPDFAGTGIGLGAGAGTGVGTGTGIDIGFDVRDTTDYDVLDDTEDTVDQESAKIINTGWGK